MVFALHLGSIISTWLWGWLMRTHFWNIKHTSFAWGIKKKWIWSSVSDQVRAWWDVGWGRLVNRGVAWVGGQRPKLTDFPTLGASTWSSRRAEPSWAMAMLLPTLPLAPLPEGLALIPLSTLTDLKVRGVSSFSAAMCPSAEGHSPAPAKPLVYFQFRPAFLWKQDPVYPYIPLPLLSTVWAPCFFLSEQHFSLLVVFSCVIVGLSSEFHAAYSCQIMLLSGSQNVTHQQLQLHLDICWKCKFVSPIPALLNQKLWQMGCVCA